MAKRALLLISDTGGGHRSAANAIVAALTNPAPATPFETRIEDVAAHCAFPLTQLGLGYSMALRYAPPLYGALYYATNGRRRYRALVRFCEPLYRERLRDLFISYQPDVIVSVHPLLNHAAMRARDDADMQHVPVITVITDLGKVHESWLVPNADAVVVPAREVYQRALSRAVSRRGVCISSAIRSIRSLTTSREAKRAARATRFAERENAGRDADGGWRRRRQASFNHTSACKGQTSDPARRRLRPQRAPRSKTQRTGAVAADADARPRLHRQDSGVFPRRRSARHQGRPRTLAEANAAQLPIIVYDYVPGQERGNVDFVRRNGLGSIALNGAAAVVRAVTALIAAPDRLEMIRAQPRSHRPASQLSPHRRAISETTKTRCWRPPPQSNPTGHPRRSRSCRREVSREIAAA